MNKRRLYMSAAVSTAALLSGNAWAQQAANTTAVETVTVTGSLISRPGFEAPTPVSVVTSADLQLQAPNTIVDALNQLPQFGNGTASQGASSNVGNAGIATINLRNLGVARTLVLVNGERVVPYSTVNTVDVNLVPTALIKRVDVVTGGASAAYGSDAVAGVVNIILDDKFVGLKGNLQYGNTTQWDYETYSGSASYGTAFDGDKGHVVASVSYSDSPQFVFSDTREWYTSKGMSAIITNPAYTPTNGQPQMITGYHVGNAKATFGGVITSGPAKNTQFVGNGVPIAFNPGIVDGAGILCTQCDGTHIGQDKIVVGQNLLTYNAYVNASYDVTSNIKASVALDYGYDSSFANNYPNVQNGTLTIQSDNAFLPPSIGNILSAQKVTSFTFGTTLGDIGLNQKGIDSPLYPARRFTERAAGDLEGTFGDGWSWKAHVGHGETHNNQLGIDDGYTAFQTLAIDAVIAPAGNTAGLPAGAIVCRSTLTAPTNGCVPVDLFGEYTASAAAKAYISPQPHFYYTTNKQDDALVSVQGSPFSIWAGPVSVAAGANYRGSWAVGIGDPLQSTRGYYAQNSANFSGQQSVYEGFGEVIAPLLVNQPFAKDMEFDAAGRITNYSTSGMVETWKLGLTDQITDEYRLRGTWSYDIRAPNLSELFSGGTVGTRAQFDPLTNTTPTVQNISQGNPNLVPEKSTTISGGVVLSPDWLPGLTASFDWYSISIKSAIATTSNAFTLCVAGQTFYCSQVVRNGALASNGIRAVSQVFSSPLNTAQAITGGLDAEIDYSTDLWGGNLSLHGTANYTDKSTSVNAGIVLNNAGSLGNDTVGGGDPKLKTVVSATYKYGPWSQTVQARVWGGAQVSKAYTAAFFRDNTVPAVGYLDLRGSYDLDFTDLVQKAQIYYAFDNVLNLPPPWIPTINTSSSAPFTLPTKAGIYDALGRRFRAGIRFNL